ncbi:MAG: hypothetical protein WC071_03985 [Victivallaceae bacterium]
MKRFSRIILFVVIILITNTATFIFAAYLSVGTTFNTNLKYTEQIDFLLNSTALRLKNDDSNLLKDISTFSEEYRTSYEGQNFIEMAKKYFPTEVKNKNFIYQALNGKKN